MNYIITVIHTYLKFYPFKKYTIKKSDPKRSALPIGDFTKLLNANLSHREVLNRSRNYYLLSFYLQGMNWMDMCLLTGKNLSRDKSRIEYHRHKTGKFSSIGLLPDAIKIIETVSNKQINQFQTNEYLLPEMRKQYDHKVYERIKSRRKRLNKYLKEIAVQIEIDPFTIYSARHTWATLQQLHGTPTPLIQAGLTHGTEEQTQEYLSGFGNEVLDKYNEEMIASLKKKEN